MTDLPSPFLIGDHPGADALNSRCAPSGEWLDWWRDGASFLDWMRVAGRLDRVPVADQAMLDEIAAEARDLREAVRTHLDEGAPVPLQALNAALARAPWADQLLIGDDGGVKPACLASGADRLLATVARDMANFLSLDNPERTRQCQGPTCTLWFRDTSRTNRRRWCSMAVCGNRAKVAAHRARTRDAEV
ncbi:CGNR zinc finger domain-containing protein [Pseudoprimorskyibacter insulae]|uniref:Zinc finger CGNR domain-containing protein n=1 Tax=Pseudoprimorskyibacter insulae TaxID=1695997 RepID=A0A2R8AUR5_9RHOB|nr:CGNR zinc finger domain-containing protein [Pseudoprimorskyibacter insulae]SPF79771.1 hypothetical protein PRI8871_01568 [Pseudoprimorskyibacter insulae]